MHLVVSHENKQIKVRKKVMKIMGRNRRILKNFG